MIEASKCMGDFELKRSLIICEPELVKKLMGKMIILRCEFLFAKDCFDYTAICDELFEKVKEGQDLQFYKILLNDDKEFIAEKSRRN